MKTILLIDDETGVTRHYKKLLESEGYKVIIANNAAEGTYAMIRERELDVILLDINMPEINGSYMWKVIQEYNPDLKVIVFSVRTTNEQRSLIPFATDYFDKSHSVEILLAKISHLLCDSGEKITANKSAAKANKKR